MPPQMAYSTSAVVHWFRRDLRLHDNWALNSALRSAASRSARFLPVYVFDKESHTCVNAGSNRTRFLHQSVSALRDALRRTMKVDLVVLQGRAADVLPKLLQEAEASELHFEIDPAPIGVEYDRIVAEALGKGVDVKRSEGHTLFEPSKLLLAAAGGKAPKSMSAFIGAMDRCGLPDEPVPLALDRGLPHGVQVPKFPSLADIGIQNADNLPPLIIPGGEEQALRRMIAFLGRKGGKEVAKFAKPETSPATFGSNRDTTLLSPYLAHGCLSCRMLFTKVNHLEKKFKASQMIQTRLTGQLMWREHFWLLARTTTNFHNEQNPLCRKIPWDRSPEAEERFNAWRDACTGFPWIDALRIQLKQEGFVHHLGRHSLACFLTRGDLWCSWEKGARVFDEELLDFDYALNAANWMWLSCSTFFNSYFRVYSPIAFGRKWDKSGSFIRKYLPVLKHIPDKYIHEPWRAPKSIQLASNCVIGKDYPSPMVDHSEVSKINIGKMREAFQRSKQETSSAPASNSVSRKRGRDDSGTTGSKKRRR